MRTSYIAFLLSGILLASCSGISDSPDEYRQWLNQPKNGLIRSKQFNNLVFTAAYKPADYFVLKEVEELPHSKELVDSVRKMYGNSIYVILEIAYADDISGDLLQHGIVSYSEYGQRVHEYAFGLKDNAQLKLNGDTLRPAIYHFERGYELGKQQRMIFAFEPESALESSFDCTFTFYDKVFGTGKHHFTFEVDPANIPGIPV